MDYPPRVRKAIDLLNAGAVRPLKGAKSFMVTSGTNEYRVSITSDHYTCTCAWGQADTDHFLSNACSHALAVAGYIDLDVPLPPTPNDDPFAGLT